MPLSARATELIRFWREAGPRQWFNKDVDFDAGFRERFLDTHLCAARRELDDWAASADGTLALLLLLDQFPRNAFRGSAHAYATDPLARHFARAGIDAGFDSAIEPALRLFCYLPFSHSEELLDQEYSVGLMRALDGESLAHAESHRAIILRFGRFPHRNAVLARPTSREEQAFLDAGGFAG